jgi:hypothetical protein
MKVQVPAMIDVDTELQKMNDLFVRRADGFVNATVLCKAFSKRWRDFILFDHRSYPFHDFLGSLQEDLMIADAEDLVQAVGEELWVHESVAVELAQWLSVDYAVALNAKVYELMCRRGRFQEQLNELVKPRVTN